MAIALFTRFAEGTSVVHQKAAVFAYSLTLHFMTILIDVAIGLVFLRRLLREAMLDPESAHG
jgi:hypothetical protein